MSRGGERSWIKVLEPEEVERSGDERLQRLYAASVDPTTGQLDNILAVHSLHTAGMEAHVALYRAVMAGTATLRKVERELVAWVVSRLNECHY